MKIRRILVSNFRGIRSLELSSLESIVVLAGENGSGKSCVLEAIRMIRSVYGSDQQNEINQWFGEYQIDFSNDPKAFTTLLNNKSEPLLIEIDIELHSTEKTYLKQNAEDLIKEQAWRTVVPELYSWRSLKAAPLSAQYRSRESEVNEQAVKDVEIFNKEIDLSLLQGRFSILPNGTPNFHSSKALELAFTRQKSDNFGIIDYHGAHRTYSREGIGSINVNLEILEEQRRQSALYNYNNKYTNIKTEMASLYVREALAEKSGFKGGIVSNLTDTLKELFATFFPDKEFLGPQPIQDGSLIFPVKIAGRESHDLDDLSSGEKEILYGYLRLRSSVPVNSIILFDEPELHLNPKLARNLPDFYFQHLAKERNNQIWLITHSDAILRNSVGRQMFSVFHITPSAQMLPSGSQGISVEVDKDLDKALIGLVGDLSAYSPGRKVVILEGEDSEFDLQMCSTLFPELPSGVNLVSGSNKTRVRGLHEILQRISDSSETSISKVYSITDRDSDGEERPPIVNHFSWDSYHIENYLLEPVYIRKALFDLFGGQGLFDESRIFDELKICAEETMQKLIIHNARMLVNSALVSSIELGVDPRCSDIGEALTRSVRKSIKRMEALVSSELSVDAVADYVEQERTRLNADLSSGSWRKSFRGRDVLKKFVRKNLGDVKYTYFRNLIIARMRDDAFRPTGMEAILRIILESRRLDG